jgi:hypothetical protein
MASDDALDWVPQSCSLPTVEQPLRVAEFDRLFSESVLRSTRLGATRLDLVLAADAEMTARDQATREVGCCSFFSFEFGSAGSDVVTRIGSRGRRRWMRSRRGRTPLPRVDCGGGAGCGQVAAAAWEKIETFRHHEQRGLLREPQRSLAGHRLYPPETVTNGCANE